MGKGPDVDVCIYDHYAVEQRAVYFAESRRDSIWIAAGVVSSRRTKPVVKQHLQVSSNPVGIQHDPLYQITLIIFNARPFESRRMGSLAHAVFLGNPG